MKLALVTDAWFPQVNGVVTTLAELVRQITDMGHEVLVIHPNQLKTMPCPGYAGIDLAWWPRSGLRAMLDAAQPDAIHIATEGPLGGAARSDCLKHKPAFSTVFHTKFPEVLHAACKVPLSWGYAWFRRFHKPSSAVMVPTQGVLAMLQARYPADGPREVLGQGNPANLGGATGGAMHTDLAQASHAALGTSRWEARSRALSFNWHAATRGFVGYLVPARPPSSVVVRHTGQPV